MAERGDLSHVSYEYWPVTTPLIRIHASAFRATRFNPCRGDPTRFAPIWVGEDCVPTLYGADTLRAALAETVLHDLDVADPFASIPEWKLTDRSLSMVLPTRPLKLIQLYRLELGKMGRDHAAHFAFDRGAYTLCQGLAAELYQMHLDADGLIWMSVRDDTRRACLLFEDRAGAALTKMSEEPLARKGPAMDTVLTELAALDIDVS